MRENELEYYNKLPLWIASLHNTIWRKQEFEVPVRLPMEIFITADNIDAENEKRYWNITYKITTDEIVVSDNIRGSSGQIDVSIEYDYDELDFIAKHEKFDTACKLLFEYLESNGHIEKYKETLKLYQK